MVLLRDEDIVVVAVREDTPVFLDAEGYHCPLCGTSRQPAELRVAAVQLRDRGGPFDVLLCVDCIERHHADDEADLDVFTS